MKRGRVSLKDTVRAGAATMALYASASPRQLSGDAVALATPESAQERVKRAARQIAEPLEKDIQKAILAYLQAHPKVAFVGRFNSGTAVASDNYGKTRYTRFNTLRGFPDIHGCLIGGRALYLEVKRPGGKETADQAEFILRAACAGATADVVTSVDEVRRLLEGA